MLYDPKWEVQTETKPVEPWRTVLLEAAEYLRKHGHCKGTAIQSDGRRCMLGAVYGACGSAFTDDYNKVFEHLRNRLGMTASAWNDRRERTADEVIAELEAAARADHLTTG